MKARAARLMRDHNELAWLAWHVEALRRTKKIPPLRKLQTREQQRPRQSPQQMLAIAKQWTLLLGGKVVDNPK